MNELSNVSEAPGQSEHLQGIGELLATLMTPEADQISLTRTVIGHSAFGSKWFTMADGSRRSASGRIAGLSRAIEELRELMYLPGAGTWHTITVTVNAAGETTAHFDQATEPEWHGAPPGPPFFERELQMFPRDPAHISDWFQKCLDGTLGRPDVA